MKISELPVPKAFIAEMEAQGFLETTSVQDAVIEADVAKDLVVSSQTGSGKTVAFGLALGLLDKDAVEVKRHKLPRALVVAPTRELALQVARELTWLYKKAGGRIATCVGGMDARREARTLHLGCEIVVGTPGRLCDHIARKALKLDDVGALVLDEADEMLDMGFREELEKILAGAPATRRTLMFSATFSKPMETLARTFTKDPLRISASVASAAHEDIEIRAHLIAPREREHAVTNVLRFHDAPSALVFCATREGVAHMHGGLVERGFDAVLLSGELSQAERNRAVQAVREGRARVLVATDVAARGLDLPAVALVVHADPPQDAQVFQHRSGRTGRAGKKGVAVMLVPAPRKRDVARILDDAGVVATLTPVPTARQIRALDDKRLVETVAALAAEASAEEAAPVSPALPGDKHDSAIVHALVEKFTPEQLASVLARSLVRELPSPEEMPETTSWKDHRNDRADRDPRGRMPRPGRPDDGIWFRVNVGREGRADPKWLLPMLCRRGGVTKRDIGPMQIRARETRFTVSKDVARRFATSAEKDDAKNPHIHIAPVD